MARVHLLAGLSWRIGITRVVPATWRDKERLPVCFSSDGMEIHAELRVIVETLERASIDYALCGGLAVAFHGYVRFTQDIDLLVRREDVDRVTAEVAKCGYRDSSGKISLGEEELRRVLKTDGTDYLALDLVVLGSSLLDVWEERELFDWEGVPIWVVSAEGLARMKRRAGRDQDMLDLKKLGFTEESLEDDAPNEDG